jgi:hypothetical protein
MQRLLVSQNSHADVRNGESVHSICMSSLVEQDPARQFDDVEPIDPWAKDLWESIGRHTFHVRVSAFYG